MFCKPYAAPHRCSRLASWVKAIRAVMGRFVAVSRILTAICSAIYTWERFDAQREPNSGYTAYCAMPRPNDQFSFKTSTRLMKTSSGRTPMDLFKRLAMPAKSAFFCGSVRM